MFEGLLAGLRETVTMVLSHVEVRQPEPEAGAVQSTVHEVVPGEYPWVACRPLEETWVLASPLLSVPRLTSRLKPAMLGVVLIPIVRV